MSKEGHSTGLTGARLTLTLLLLINLFNYIDRQILSAVAPSIKRSFFAAGSTHPVLDWFQHHLGFKPQNALLGVLSMAFMVVYMMGAPVFGRLG